jgi:hypothetical protein
METECRTIGVGGELSVRCAARAEGNDVSIPWTGSHSRIAAAVARKSGTNQQHHFTVAMRDKKNAACKTYRRRAKPLAASGLRPLKRG